MVESFIFVICLLIYAGVAGFVILSPFIIAFIIWFIRSIKKAFKEMEEEERKRHEYINSFNVKMPQRNKQQGE